MNSNGGGPGGVTSAQRRAGAAAFEDARADGDLPEIDFQTFVLSLAHSVRIHLGDAPDPTGVDTQLNLPMARQNIDLLALLQQKTKGNLTGEEEVTLDQILYDLRMRYVEVAKGE